jgi:hypothetical protein
MLRRVLLALSLCAFLPAAASAQLRTGIGPRVGVSIGPDQLLLGGQAIIGEIAPNLTFDPSLELGFGDDVTTFAANFDLHYHFDIENVTWRPYAGFGADIVVFEPDGPGDGDTEVGGGLIIGAGAPTSSGNRFFGEMKFGLGDVPDLKIVVGWNFKT